MPNFEITAPDGARYRVTAPEGATEDQVLAYAQSQFGQQPQEREDVSAGMALSGVPVLGAFVPQAEAALRAATGQGEGSNFSERYANILPKRQALYKQAEEESPITSTALKIGGGVAALAPIGLTAAGARALGMTGPSLLARTGAGAASGALIGAADSAARGDSPVTGGEIGAVTGAAGPVVGQAIGAGVRGIRNMLPVSRLPQLTTDVAGVPVPITRGQATGDVVAQQEEQAALRGALGQRPAAAARQFFEGEQAPAVEQARGVVGRGLDEFGMNIVDNPQAAGELVGESVQRAASRSKAGYKQLYDEAFSAPGSIDSIAFRNVGTRIKGELADAQSPVIVDDVTTPIASRMIQHIDNQISNLRVQNRANPNAPPNPDEIVAINMAGIDQTRKQLLAMARSTQRGSSDNRAASRVISEFDNNVRSAIDNGFFSGDPRVLDALDNARRAYSQHRSLFTRQGQGDDVGAAMERIVGRNGQEGATPTEIANYLYGQARVGGTGLSVRLADRMRTVLGADSPEWTAIRQGLWSRLSQATEGATQFGSQKSFNRISEFLNGSGKPLADRMFTAQERALMREFENFQRQITPRPGAVNYSNTAGVSAGILRRLLARAATTIGIAIGGGIGSAGGVLGSIGGAAAGAGLGGVANRIIEGGATRSVARSLRGLPPARQDPVSQAFQQQMSRYSALAAQGAVPGLVSGLAARPQPGTR